MNKMLSACPVCAESLHVSELSCERCGTRVQSAFETCRFCRLTRDQMRFVELFLRNRGNISNVGQELGLSYPTVAKRLDAVLAALDLPEEDGEDWRQPVAIGARAAEKELGRRQVLEMLDRGEITAEEATRRMKEL